jgi:hypothetical protein
MSITFYNDLTQHLDDEVEVHHPDERAIQAILYCSDNRTVLEGYVCLPAYRQLVSTQSGRSRHS